MKNDGGAAFPGVGQTKFVERDPPYSTQVIANYAGGMSLRDWFAGMALSGIEDDASSAYDRARWCYLMAKAMLEEKEKLDAPTSDG